MIIETAFLLNLKNNGYLKTIVATMYFGIECDKFITKDYKKWKYILKLYITSE